MKPRAHRRIRAFTLMELLIVIGLIAVLAAAFTGALAGSSRSVALESAQASLANFVSAARSRAVASGRPVRVLVRNQPDRQDYRRLFVLLQLRTLGADENVASNWEVVSTLELPAGIFLLPDVNQMPANLLANPPTWVGGSGAIMRSSLLFNVTFGFNFDGQTEQWEYFGFTEYGTNADTNGDLILATGQTLAPDLTQSGARVELSNPDAVRGLTMSIYGVARLVHDRHGF
jgi:prepilin-type N-terminal cleavage/methylation domain-containing protein